MYNIIKAIFILNVQFGRINLIHLYVLTNIHKIMYSYCIQKYGYNPSILSYSFFTTKHSHITGRIVNNVFNNNMVISKIIYY